ncbi:MAG: indolepyruvate ferredoxin oxidoreductase, partial [Bacteroidales bacterium]|nr:indolepyruvate ferredoxin oxidoreductase [Bacteroidales bacterium]
SVNEKTAMESALGMSYAGKRVMVCMKHVGLNVAADAFVNAAITGANGGLIVVAADDPSMHSSQNEQDSRFFGKFAMMPILEPSSQQEAYDMVHEAFDLSEKFSIPVLMRITTRLAHSRAGVKPRAKREQNPVQIPSDPRQFILLPANARRNYKKLLANQVSFETEAGASSFNQFIDGKDTSMGIIACGLAYNYLMENYPSREVGHPVLKIGQYPVPPSLIRKIYDQCDSLLILEDGYPILEELIRGYLNNGKVIHGRLDGRIPRDGELDPNNVGSALGIQRQEGRPVPSLVVPRPPSLCKGCPHIYSYNSLNEALNTYSKGRVFSDIGCYTLGALQPFDAINTCVDMGASITMAKGAADAGFRPAVAVIGDSTFTHSGITGLIDAVNDNSPITVLILDNGTTAMTGGQDSMATGRIEAICEGCGVEKEHIHVINPIQKYHDENMAIMKREIEYEGVSVIIPRRECLVTVASRIRSQKKEPSEA